MSNAADFHVGYGVKDKEGCTGRVIGTTDNHVLVKYDDNYTRNILHNERAFIKRFVEGGPDKEELYRCNWFAPSSLKIIQNIAIGDKVCVVGGPYEYLHRKIGTVKIIDGGTSKCCFGIEFPIKYSKELKVPSHHLDNRDTDYLPVSLKVNKGNICLWARYEQINKVNSNSSLETYTFTVDKSKRLVTCTCDGISKTAKCHPDDEFYAERGIFISYRRVNSAKFGEETMEGEYVCIKDLENYFTKGKIYTLYASCVELDNGELITLRPNNAAEYFLKIQK